MSTLINNPLNPMFNAATMMMAKIVWPQWFDVSLDTAPDSLKRLKAEYAERGRITVFGGSSDKTIFGVHGAEVNHAFRAWHDWCHLSLNADFSMDGEARACELQARHIRTYYGDGDTGQELVAILYAEVVGQASHYYRYKEYVQDQRAFVEAYIKHGATETLSQKW